MTPDLRRRVGVPQLSTDLTSASAREGGEATTRLGDCTVSETDTSVPSSGGLGTSQPSRKDGKCELIYYIHVNVALRNMPVNVIVLYCYTSYSSSTRTLQYLSDILFFQKKGIECV